MTWRVWVSVFVMLPLKLLNKIMRSLNWPILSFPITRTSIVMLKKSHIFNLCITFLPFHVSKNPFGSIISTPWSSMCAIFNVKNRMIKKLLVFVWVPFFFTHPVLSKNILGLWSCIYICGFIHVKTIQLISYFFACLPN